MSMQRREFLKVGAAGVAASALAAPAIAQSMPEVRWRLTASWPKSLDTLYGACETIAKYVGEATDQKFQIQVFAAGEIVPALQVLDACQNGTVEMGHTATYYYIGKDPTWALFCAVPFGLNTRQQNAWFYDGDGMKLMNEFGKKYNVYSPAAIFIPPWRRAPLMRPSGSVLTMTRSSASTRLRRTTIIPVGGKAAPRTTS